MAKPVHSRLTAKQHLLSSAQQFWSLELANIETNSETALLSYSEQHRSNYGGMRLMLDAQVVTGAGIGASKTKPVACCALLWVILTQSHFSAAPPYTWV